MTFPRSGSPDGRGPDLFFAGGEALTRTGRLVRAGSKPEDAADETATRNSDAEAIGRDGILRTWDVDVPRVEWLNEVDLDATRNLFGRSTRPADWGFTRATFEETSNPEFGRLVSDFSAAQSHFATILLTKEAAVQARVYSIEIQRTARGRFAEIWFYGNSNANRVELQVDLETGLAQPGFPVQVGAGFDLVDAGVDVVTPGKSARLWIAANTNTDAVVNMRVHLVDDVTQAESFDGDGVTALVYGRYQMEAGTAPTAFQATPRDTDHKFPSLLLEAAATNGWTFSEELDNAAWTKVRASVQVNAVVAPDGSGTADRLAEDTSVDTDHYFLRDTGALADNTRTTISLFAKAQSRSNILLGMRTKTGNVRQVWFDLAGGRIGSSTGGGDPQPAMTDYGDGWYRCSISVDSESGATAPRVECRLGLVSETTIYTGDGTSGVNFWGMQVEIDSGAPSSYIPTEGVTVTRAADLFSGPYPHPPQGMTVYMKGQERASFGGGTVYQWQIGTNTPAFFLQVFSDRFRLFLNNGVTTTSSESSTGFPTQDIPPGTLAEYVCQLYGDGSVQLRVTVGGVETVMPRSAAIGLPAEWAGPALWVNSRSQGSHSSMAHLAVKAHRGVRSLDFMRGL